MEERLWSSAARFGEMAGKAFVAGDFQLFYVAAGTAVEHLAKSFLVRKHPTLIVEKSDFDTLLSFLGIPGAKPAHQLRTISAREAVTRCAQLVPALTPMVKETHELMDVRNGVVHLATVGQHEAGSALVNLARVVEQLLGAVQRTQREFWGSYTSAVSEQVSEAATRAEKRFAAKRAAARELYRQRYGEDPEALGLIALRQAVKTQRLARYEEHLLDCPACGEQAVAAGTFHPEEHADYDQEGADEYWVSGVYVVVTFFPTDLRCAFCDLHLTGEEEMRTAGITSWELDPDDVDPDDFRDDDYEPDENYLRGR